MDKQEGSKPMKWIYRLFGVTMSMSAMAENVDVFFLGGQSNATHDWRKGIEAELREAYGEKPFVIVHVFHPGRWLREWITDEPQALFGEDFFNAEGTGALEVEFRKLQKQGHTPVWRGLFWLQGEGDTGNPKEQALYAERFLRMRAQVAEQLGAKLPPFAVGIIDANQDPKYDDPEEAAGRTREKIKGMRQVLKKLGEEPD
jgi:hypothetical protein